MYSFTVNPLGVILAALAMMVIGALWYSQFLFAKPWMRLTGLTPETMPKGRNAIIRAYAGSVVVAFVSAYVLSVFQKNLFIPDVKQALLVGFFGWLGFTATAYVNDHSFNPKRTPWKLFAITTGFYLAAFLVQCMIIFIFS
jgi:hypothetical protein